MTFVAIGAAVIAVAWVLALAMARGGPATPAREPAHTPARPRDAGGPAQWTDPETTHDDPPAWVDPESRHMDLLLLALTGATGTAAIAWHLAATAGTRKDNR